MGQRAVNKGEDSEIGSCEGHLSDKPNSCN